MVAFVLSAAPATNCPLSALNVFSSGNHDTDMFIRRAANLWSIGQVTALTAKGPTYLRQNLVD